MDYRKSDFRFTFLMFMAARPTLRGTKFGGGESDGGAGIPFLHTPFSSRPARAFSFCRAKRSSQLMFRSK